MKIAVVGATGLVGSTILKVLNEYRIPIKELLPVASQASIGKKVLFSGKEYKVIGASEAIAARPDIAIFSAGSTVSKELAPEFASAGCRVIDNSSCWRMDPEIKLVIPEINGNLITGDDMIIANPNCSTIQMLMAINPIYRTYGIKRIVVSTYQSITGTGYKAVRQMDFGMGRISRCISVSHRREHIAAHRLVSGKRIYKRRNEDGKRNTQDTWR